MEWLEAQRKSWPSCELNPTWVIVGELGKSWPGVFIRNPQYLRKKKDWEQWPLSVHSLPWCGVGGITLSGEWLAFPVTQCRITLPWLVLDLTLCIKDTDILAIDYVAERLLLRFSAVAAGNIREHHMKAYAASLPGATAACVCQPRGHTAEPFSVLKVSPHTRAALGTHCAYLHWQQHRLWALREALAFWSKKVKLADRSSSWS